jgi:hypothetical protein
LAFRILGIAFSNFGLETEQNDYIFVLIGNLFHSTLWSAVSDALVGLLFIPEDGASTLAQNFNEILLACSTAQRDRRQFRSCFYEELKSDMHLPYSAK